MDFQLFLMMLLCLFILPITMVWSEPADNIIQRVGEESDHIADVTPPELTFEEMLLRLEDMSKQERNDERQVKYCSYINTFLKDMNGKEKTMLVGSTADGTRLRTRRDDGDYDYLLISGITIPVGLLHYREATKCFVQIHGIPLRQAIPVDLIDGVYLPSKLLKTVHPAAFKELKGIFELVTNADFQKGDNSINLGVTRPSKPGLEYTKYVDLKTDEDVSISPKENDESVEGIQEHFDDKVKDADHIKTEGDAVIESFGKIFDFIQDIKTNNNGRVYQEYGNLLNALQGRLSRSGSVDSDNMETTESAIEDTEDIENTGENIDVSSDEPSCDKEGGSSTESCGSRQTNPWEETKEEPFLKRVQNEQCDMTVTETVSQRGEEADNVIRARYSRKAKRDFVAVFPLSGRPEYMNEWNLRTRKWPPPDVVQSIYNGQFFVAAKPAIFEPQPSKDFCLSYNTAEIKLGRAFSRGQRRVLLVLKAFQRQVMRKYSEVLTSFHWKTALYWVSEEQDPSLFALDNLEKAVHTVLKFMLKSLCMSYLEHYFIPSNLFKGMNDAVRVVIMTKVWEISKDPIGALGEFFKLESSQEKESVYVRVPGEQTHLKEKTKKTVSKKTKDKINKVVSALEHFGRGEENKLDTYIKTLEGKDARIVEALLNVAEDGLTDMLKEREENLRNDGRDDLLNAPRATIEEVLTSLRVYMSAKGSDLESIQKARQNLKEVAISCFMLQEEMNNNT